MIYVKIADGKASCGRCDEPFGDAEDGFVVVLGRRWSAFKDVGPYARLWTRAKGSHAPAQSTAIYHGDPADRPQRFSSVLRCPKCGADQLATHVRATIDRPWPPKRG